MKGLGKPYLSDTRGKENSLVKKKDEKRLNMVEKNRSEPAHSGPHANFRHLKPKTTGNGNQILILMLIFVGGGSIQEISRMYTSYGRRILPQNLGKIWSDTKEPRLLPKYSAKGSGAWRALTCPNAPRGL